VKARGAFVATLLGVMLMSALYPLRQYASQDSHVNALVRQERALETKIAALKRQQNLLLTDDEIERIAREELGMVRPGEVAFAVVGGAPAGPAPKKVQAAPASIAQESGGRAWHERWWDAMARALTGMR